MNCEIVSVGDEVVGGRVADTNAAWLAQRLAAVGLDCSRHAAVTDDVGVIAEAVSAAAVRAAVVVVTGGLGPTRDDVTREGLARAAGVALHSSLPGFAPREPRDRRSLPKEEVPVEKDDAGNAGLERTRQELEQRQSLMPKGGRALSNTVGTAPGVCLVIGDCVVYALPGVPLEMERMFLDEVVVDLHRRGRAGVPLASRVLRVAGEPEAVVAARLADVWPEPRGPVRMALLAGGGEVQVRLSLSSGGSEQFGSVSGAELLDRAQAQVRARLGRSVYGGESDCLEAVVGELLMSRGLTVATAESLTGGALGARLTSVVGASRFYRGGAVTYATDTKVGMLGVPQALIDSEGVVSEAVACAMARGVRDRFGADIGLATTGVAGPGPGDGVPAGTVWMALAEGQSATAWNVEFLGTREQVVRRTVTAIIDVLRRRLGQA